MYARAARDSASVLPVCVPKNAIAKRPTSTRHVLVLVLRDNALVWLSGIRVGNARRSYMRRRRVPACVRACVACRADMNAVRLFRVFQAT